MATLINENGNRDPIIPKGDFFTLQQITEIIQDIVEPLFIGEYWIFHGKNSKQNKSFNNLATSLIGYELFGRVLLVTDDELSPTFFFPPDIVDYIKNMSKSIHSEIKKESRRPKSPAGHDDDEEHLTKEQLAEAEEKIMNISYDNLFKTNKSFETIIKNFELFNDGINKIYIKDDYKERVDAMNKLMDFFSKEEEYEKCKNIKDFINKLHNYYRNK